MIKKEGPTTLHNSVVSSQFDADRLDYMQRDRMMTGSKHSAIDLTWLLANLDVGEVRTGVDDVELDPIPTFVIGSKSIQAAEAYVLGLFQLYPTIYFHKATRGAEKIFTEILVRIVTLVGEESLGQTGLPSNHPLIKFAYAPESVETLLQLDDAVIYGALHLLVEAKDELLSNFATRLLNRKLFKCSDIRTSVSHKVDPHNEKKEEHTELIEKCCASVMLELQELENGQGNVIPQMILDEAERNPYKPGGGKHGPREQITVCTEGGEFIDISQRSEIVKSLSVYKLNRVYFDSSNGDVQKIVDDVIEDVVQRETV